MGRIGVVLALFLALLPLTAIAQETDITLEDLQKQAAERDDKSLTDWAGRYADALEATDKDVRRLENQLAAAAEDKKADLQKQLDAAKVRKGTLADYLKALIREMDGRDLDTAQLKVRLTEVTGVVDLDSFGADVALGLADRWLTKGKDWLVDEGPGVAFKILLFLVILLVFKVLAAVLGRVTRAAMASSKLKISSLLRDFFVTVVTKTVFIVGLLIAISTIGIDIGPLLAGVGVLGFIIGFALQGTLSNFAAGIMILLYRPYDVGDVVNAAGVLGKVESMSLVSTTILTPDNQKVIVPNNSIWGGVITNITAMPKRRVDLTVGVGYGDDLDRTQEVLMEVVKAHSLVLQDPEPVVMVTNLGESSVDFVVRPWCKTSDYWTVYWDLTKSIKQRLDQEEISIPFPQRDVHIQGGDAA